MSKPVYSLPQVIEQLRINWGGTFDQGEHRDWSDEQEVTYRINSNGKMDAHQVTMARMAYELWDDLVAISLREVSSGDGEVSFAYSDSESFAITYTDEELFGTHLDDADSRFSTKSNTLASANIQFGKYGFETYLHEIGHALGLTHPGQYDESDSADPTYEDDANHAQDTRQYTIMSYFAEGKDGSGADYDSSSLAGPMLHDIAAVQAIYGADYTTRTGNTVYGFNSNAGKWIDGQWLNPFDFTQNSEPVFAIWDAGGIDTLDTSGYGNSRGTMKQFIDLRAGTFSDIGGLTKNIAIAFGVTIENAKGGSNADIFIGNEVGNHIEGLGGNDYMLGLEGNDILDGGNGDDQAYGGVGNDTLYGGAGKDTLLGEGDNDTIWGGADDDFLHGGAGQDVLRGGLGNDTLEGGEGGDVLDGYGEGGPVVVMQSTVAKTVNTANLASSANLINVGNAFDLDGSSTDTASYDNARASVTVNLTNTALNTGEAAGDSYISIERFDLSSFNDGFVGADGAFGGDWACGGNGNDFMQGMAGNDVLEGQFGNDSLDGGAGKDRLEGGDGNDYINGGAGADSYLGGAGDDALGVTGDQGIGDTFSGSAGLDTLLLEGATANTVSKLDTKGSSIEQVFGHGGALLGASDATFIDLSNLSAITQVTFVSGQAGDDGIVGSKFADDLRGGAGTDILSGLDANDRLDGGLGRDFMLGGAGADDFDYNSIKDTGKTTATRDRIGDFKHGQDDIDLKTIDANGSAAGNAAFKFLAKEGAAFTGVKGQLHWLQIDKAGTANDKTLIEGDVNGDHKADFQIELTGLKMLTVGDFIL